MQVWLVCCCTAVRLAALLAAPTAAAVWFLCIGGAAAQVGGVQHGGEWCGSSSGLGRCCVLCADVCLAYGAIQQVLCVNLLLTLRRRSVLKPAETGVVCMRLSAQHSHRIVARTTSCYCAVAAVLAPCTA
jgi:hypothetical protein